MTGRPRTFDRDQALETALLAFWERGYDGVSIAQLTAEIGIGAPSLYAAFGDKRRLFGEVVQRYLTRLERGRATALGAPTAREGVDRLLRATAEGHTSTECAQGCLVMSEPVLDAERRRNRDAIRDRLLEGRDAGELAAGADLDALADLIDVVLAGMSARARDGATRAQLEAVIDQVMRAWPTPDRDARAVIADVGATPLR